MLATPPNAALTVPPIDADMHALIHLAVREDMGHTAAGGLLGDKTVELSIPPDMQASAKIIARKSGIISGTILIAPVLREYPGEVQSTILVPDGSTVAANQPVAILRGPARTILSAERVLLNFLSHLSGIATLTRRYADSIAHIHSTAEGTTPLICDTRKTTPAFRALDKYAVRCGGGVNHRIGLYDGVMLKDNHLAALRDTLGQAGLTLFQLAAQVRRRLDPAITLWLEVDALAQLADALPPLGDSPPAADIILLDNFSPDQMREAVRLRNQSKIENRKSKILLEASGGITLENLPQIAQTGVDRISIGALTHSAPALDLSMELS